jgi:hypothetical protein
MHYRHWKPGGGHCRKLEEKSRCLIKVPLLTAVYDVSGVAAMNSVSSNPILLSACRYMGKERGDFNAPPLPPEKQIGIYWGNLFFRFIDTRLRQVETQNKQKIVFIFKY